MAAIIYKISVVGSNKICIVWLYIILVKNFCNILDYISTVLQTLYLQNFLCHAMNISTGYYKFVIKLVRLFK